MIYASGKKVKISDHALQRFHERTNIPTKDIKSYLSSVRNSGIHLESLTPYVCEKMHYNFSLSFYHYLTHYFVQKYNSNKIILYKDNVFIFAGNNSRTLITVIEIPDSFKGWWKK